MSSLSDREVEGWMMKMAMGVKCGAVISRGGNLFKFV
jgi:hypothetical protein